MGILIVDAAVLAWFLWDTSSFSAGDDAHDLGLSTQPFQNGCPSLFKVFTFTSRCLEATPFKWPAHRQGRQACKCLCYSKHSRRIRTAPFVAADQASARARLPILEVATWPLDCLIRARVQRLDIACESRAGQPVAGALSRHATPSISESSVMWLGGFKRAGRCAVLCRWTLLLHWSQFLFKCVRWWQPKGKRGKSKGFGGDSVLAFCTR